MGLSKGRGIISFKPLYARAGEAHYCAREAQPVSRQPEPPARRQTRRRLIRALLRYVRQLERDVGEGDSGEQHRPDSKFDQYLTRSSQQHLQWRCDRLGLSG